MARLQGYLGPGPVSMDQPVYVLVYSGTSLLRSPTGLGKSDLNGEVTLLQGVICTVEYNLGLSQGDCNWEVFLLVR